MRRQRRPHRSPASKAVHRCRRANRYRGGGLILGGAGLQFLKAAVPADRATGGRARPTAHNHPELTDRMIWQASEAERPQLVPISGPFDGFSVIQASVSKTCL